MSNPFSTPNIHSGQYAPHAFYTPYNASPQTPNSNTPTSFSQAIHHSQAFPVMASNAKRFEANAHVPSPPIPLQFPPNWNPDMLRQLAASSNLQFPIPPPPPPPPPQMFASSFPPSLHTVAAHSLPRQQQPLTQFQNRRPSPQAPNRIPAESHTESGSTSRVVEGERAPDSSYKEPQDHFQPTQNIHNQPMYNLDGAVFSRSSHQQSPSAASAPLAAQSSDVEKQWNARVPTQHVATPRLEDSQVASSYQDLHVKAKAAIAQCATFGATYHFWLESGVKQPVVDKLFAELNLDRPNSPAAPPLQPSQDVSSTSKPLDTGTSRQQPIVEVSESTDLKQSEMLDPAMERKDRIARLLAAKKGQSLASAKSSQSASPVPTETTSRLSNEIAFQPKQSVSIANDMVTTRIDRESSQPQHSPDIVTHAEPTMSTIDQTGFPTPVREQMQHQGFSIPGLFLTAAESRAEPKGLGVLSNLKHPDVDVVQEPTVLSPTRPRSQKRVADPLPTHILPQAKRQASYPASSAEDVVMTNTKIHSPPETQTSDAVHTQSFETKDLPASHNSEKPTDSGAPVPKSKINQDKLKDRMAALKADLLRKNSRKKDLQEGMPVLDAEVQKTRNRLQEQQDQLASLRRTINLKASELADARERENQLVLEIQRLEHHLADGENGQKQFSRELNQLNTQIVADEKAATLEKPDVIRESGTYQLDKQVNLSLSHNEDSEQYGPAKEALEPKHVQGIQFPKHDIVDTKTDASDTRNPMQINDESRTVPSNAGTGVGTTDGLFANEEQSTQIEFGASITQSESQSHLESDDDRMSIDEASDEESSGSASMSDSPSEDYEPSINDSPASLSVAPENEDYEPADGLLYDQTAEAENDEYEPAEQVDFINTDTLVTTNGSKQASPTSASNRTALPNMEQPSPVPSPTEEEAPMSTTCSSPPASVNQAPNSGVASDDELNQHQVNSTDIPEPLIVPSAEHDQFALSRFVPYQSPLSNFKSFRFHPQFNELVKHGYRSLTYSNNIDAKKPLCSTELEGKICTDVKCIDQHFGSMALSDDKILVQMSSANDLKDKQQRDDYLIGLKKVIADLRGQGVKEFGEVANALSNYRREWMQRQDEIVT